jgi:hypothetical protein
MSANSSLNYAFQDLGAPFCTSVQTNTTYPTTITLQSKPKQKKTIDGRIPSIDLRIGLNLLGEEGRLHLLRYIKVKSQSQRASLAEQHKVACG